MDTVRGGVAGRRTRASIALGSDINTDMDIVTVDPAMDSYRFVRSAQRQPHFPSHRVIPPDWKTL
jgi:hypothetical protein